MLVLILGIALFAIGILTSVALHEAGHMVAAKSFGMRVRRYFVGFGPRIFSFRRGGTEYGVKAIPLGGFCDIAGMTNLDEVTEDEAPRAMWRFRVWKRTVVMAAGSVTHFMLGFIVLYLLAATLGLPNDEQTPKVVDISACVQDSSTPSEFANPKCQPSDPSPAKNSELRVGDVILAVGGVRTETYPEVIEEIQQSAGPTTLKVRRDDRTLRLSVDVATVKHPVPTPNDPDTETRIVRTGAIGATFPNTLSYAPLEAFVQTAEFTGDLFYRTWQGLIHLPQKIPELIAAISGEQVKNRPVSVVGASHIGGQLAKHGLWVAFLVLLASINYFIGVLNLLPLLPLDGGHIAVTWYEKIRDWLRRLRGKQPGGPPDYSKLNAVTAVFIVIIGSFMLLTVIADLVNPVIQLN